jgi:hypothetical protein
LANPWTAYGSWKRLFVARKRRFHRQGETAFIKRASQNLSERVRCATPYVIARFASSEQRPNSQSLTRERTMGLFDRLFGTTAPAHKFFAKFKRNSQAPTDPDLFKIAKDRKGHISRKAVLAEYNRLILEKYAHDKA